MNQNYNSNMSLKEIGELIKIRRDFLKLRQEDLSELSKVNMRTIHLVEQGSGNPSFETLHKISAVLGLTITLEIKKTS